MKGKLICGLIGLVIGDLSGLPLGGLTGFIIGSVLGHYFFDQPKETAEEDSAFRSYQRRQGQFIFHAFRMAAKVAKSDGTVNRSEINHMEQLMRQHFRMSDSGRNQAIKIWKQAKESTDPFDYYARSFYTDFGKERHHILNMMDLLFSIAASDGSLHPREEELLLRAAGIFHIGRLQYDRIKSRYFQTTASQQPRYSPLDPYYAILGAEPTESLDVIKKKYRNLAMQWHPDKVAARGMTTEAQRHAKEKFQKINEAWEKIEDSRKVSR